MQLITTKDENFSFWKNLFLTAIFFTVTPIILATSMFSLISFSKTQKTTDSLSTSNSISSPQSGVRVFASLPIEFPSVNGVATTSDARAEIVRQYLESYNSPLTPYAPVIITAADKYQLDFRLITAIAQQESNLCKIYPEGTFNCWGWGIHSEGTLGFSSFEEAIDTVSEGLRSEYLNKGLVAPEEIMTKYTPLSNGSWANGVNKFMAEME